MKLCKKCRDKLKEEENTLGDKIYLYVIKRSDKKKSTTISDIMKKFNTTYAQGHKILSRLTKEKRLRLA